MVVMVINIVADNVIASAAHESELGRLFDFMTDSNAQIASASFDAILALAQRKSKNLSEGIVASLCTY